MRITFSPKHPPAREVSAHAGALSTLMLLTALAAPSAARAVTAEGPLVDLADQYIQGTTSYGIELCYEDSSEPISRVALEENGSYIIDEIILSSSFTQALTTSCMDPISDSVDLSTRPEGTYTYQAWSWDTSTAPYPSEPWTVVIDRTAPVFPTEFHVGARESATGKIWVYWDEADDPALADGTSGSDVIQYQVRVPGGTWISENEVGTQIDEPTSASNLEVRAIDRAGNVSSVVSAPITMLASDPEDSVALDVTPPTPEDEDYDADAADPLPQDRQWELDQYFGDDEEEPSALASPGGSFMTSSMNILQATYPPNGKHDPDRLFRCAGEWAPIQASVSGFVIGNCEGDEWVVGYKAKVVPASTPVEDWPGAPSEGRGWEAVSLPASAHFDGCGWINIAKRLYDPQSTPPSNLVNRCDAGPVEDRVHPANYELGEFIKKYTGNRVGGAPTRNSRKYDKLYIWATRIKRNGVWREMSGKKYVPQFSNPNKYCHAYANINPYKSGQQVLSSERTFAVHHNSQNIRLRYIARFRARDEDNNLTWWVMLHSVHPTDRLMNWGFVSANCLFEN